MKSLLGVTNLKDEKSYSHLKRLCWNEVLYSSELIEKKYYIIVLLYYSIGI